MQKNIMIRCSNHTHNVDILINITPHANTILHDLETVKNSRINLEQLRTFTNGDKNVEKELLRLFIKQSEKNLRVLSQPCDNNNNMPWIDAAHMFKGGASIIGATCLQQLCADAQNLTHNTKKERLMLFEKIHTEYNHIKKELQERELL